MLRHFEPGAEIESIARDHQQIARSPAAKLISQMEGGIRERAVPAGLERTPGRASPVPTQHQGIAGEWLVDNLLTLSAEPRLAVAAAHPDAPHLRLGRHQRHRRL